MARKDVKKLERKTSSNKPITYYDALAGKEVTVQRTTSYYDVRSGKNQTIGSNGVSANPIARPSSFRSQLANEKDSAYKKAMEEASARSAAQANLLHQQRARSQDIRNNPNAALQSLMDQYDQTMSMLAKGNYDPSYALERSKHLVDTSKDLSAQFTMAGINNDEIRGFLKSIEDGSRMTALDPNAGQMQFLNTLTDPNEKLEYLYQIDPNRAVSMLNNMEQSAKNWTDIYRNQLNELKPTKENNAEIQSLENRLTEAESDIVEAENYYEDLASRKWYAELQKYPAIVFDRARKQGNTEQADIAWNYLSATDPTRAMQMAEEILAEMTRERQELVDLYNADPFSFSDESDQRWAYLDEEITKWNELLHKATYQMEGVRMGDVARADSESYDPRFAEFSQYNSIGEYLEPEQMNVAGRIYEYINNDDTAYRMRLAAETDTLTGIPYAADFEKYRLMNDEEIALFNYYYVNDPEQALHYLDTISETLNYRAAVEDYKENWKGKPWKEALLGAWQSGFNQYLAGSESVGHMIAGDNYIPTTKGEYLSGMMREDLSDSKFATGVYDVGSSIANMLPSVLVSSVSPVAGKIVFGASVSGNAYKEAVNKGFDPKAARWYAGAIGAAEVFLQDALGGISKMSGANNLTDKVVNGLLSKVDNAIGRAAIQLGASSMGEATEEYLQEIIGPVLENVILGAHNDINLISEEAIYAGILGAFTALPMNMASPGTEGFIGNIGTAMRENLVATVNKPYASEVVAEAKTYNAGSETLKRVEKQMAKGGAENISNRDLALLVQENAEVAKKDERSTFQPKPKETEKKPSRTIPVNKNGTATTDAGESVAVRGVGYVDGNVLVRVADENGTERNVSRSTLDLSDDVADLVDLAAQYGYAAPAVYAAFDNSMDFDHYADDVEMIMSMAKGSVGVNGTKALNWLKNNQNIKMEPEAIETLFAAGREIGIKEQPLIRRGTGKVTFAEGIDRTKLKGRQKAQVEFLEEFAKLVGVDIEFFESSVENGQYVGENGSYIDNRIRIDLNAGRNYESDSMAKIAITRTASHELTHWLKDIAPKEYQMLRDFVIEKMIDEGGGTLQSLIETKQLRAKGDLSVDDALDEIVADGAELMLGKSQYLREYAQRNAKGYETIKEWLKNFLAKLKKAFEGIGSAHAESRILMQKYADEMISLWDNALKSGLENEAAPISETAKVKDDIVAVSAAKIGIDVDTATESVAPAEVHSERTWIDSDYVKARNEAAAEIAKAIGVTPEKAKAYIDDVNSIARMIAEDRTRLDYFSSPHKSSFVSNAEYGGSFDFSTLCKKRRLLTGTFTAIQRALPNTALTSDEILEIRNRMKAAGLEVSCGLCYVEGSRANMGQFAKEFLRLYKQYYPDAWQPDMADVNTPDGVEWMRLNHPEAYEQYEYFWNHYGTLKPGDKNLFASQQKPKLYQLHTEYKGEILTKFNNENKSEESNKDTIKSKNDNGGIRLQSFSDFEIVHLIDCMQIIMDMSRVGLAGQAYTKVPDFAWALGDTGLKINLSLIAKGVDADGKLIFDDIEGMPIAEAMKLRDRYSKNVGTILVAFNDEQLMAAMADDRVDFIIPFHRSQWKKSQYAAMGLPAKTKDYTFMQNEKFIKPQFHEYRGRMVKDKATNYMPNDYWDFNKTGKENAEHYLAMCAANNKRPKFYKLLQNNGDGSYSLKADGSTDGYWKLLIDFKMYDNNGVGSPQMPVQPVFNMDEANRMLNEYKGGHNSFPVAQEIADQFIAEKKSGSVKFSEATITESKTKASKQSKLADDIATKYGLKDGEKMSERDPLTEEIVRLESQIARLERKASEAFLAGQMRTARQAGKEVREQIEKAELKQENLEAQIKKLKADNAKAVKEAELAGEMRVARQAGKDIRQREEKIAELQQMVEDTKQTIRDLKTGHGKELAEMRQKLKDLKKQDAQRLRDYRANRNESDAVKKYRRHVEKHIKDLQDMLFTNTDKKHIPEPLKEPIGKFLDSLMPQMYSRSAYEKGNITNKDVKLLNTWNKLEDALRGQTDSQRGMGTEGKFDFEGYLDLPPDMMDEFKKLKDAVGNLAENARLDDPLYQLSSGDLQRLEWILRVIKQSVNQANQMLAAPRESLRNTARSSIDEMAELGETKLPGKIGGILGKFLTWDNTTPFYAFKRFGEGGKIIFNAIAAGWDKLAFNSKTVIDFSESTYTEKEVKAWTEKTHDFELESGETVRMTEAQMMALYCLSHRPQAMNHLLGGGIRVANIEKGKNKIQQSEPRLLTLDDIEMINGALTAHQREVADKIQRFMTEKGSEWGNEVSMKRFGYRAFTEEVYFPILSDQNNFAAIDAEAKANDLFRLLNISATKALTENANNAIVIQDIFDVYAAHMSDMAKYNALALPVLDAFKWINYKEDTTNADGTRETVTVQRAMEKAYGKQAQQYIITLLKDLNAAQTGGRRDSGIGNIFFSNAKVASVAANVRVALLQPTAYIKAANLIDPKWLAAGAAMTPKQHKASVDEMLKHSGIALWKDLGFYDTNIGRSLTEKIKHSESLKDKAVEKSMALAEMGDRFTWGVLWNACKREVLATQHLHDEALLKATAERFREVVYATQVVDSTLTRSHIMRDKDGLTKMATSFMSEPTIAYNMLMEQYTNFVTSLRKTGSKGQAWQENWKGMARAAGAFSVTALATALVEALTDIAREDEEKYAIWEKAFWKKYMAYAGTNFASNLNPAGMVPIIRDIVSALEGFAINRQDVEWVTTLIEAFKTLQEFYKVATGKQESATKLTYYGNMTGFGVAYKVLKGVSMMSGLPISALVREVQVLWNNSVGLFREDLLWKTYDAGDEEDTKSAYSEGYITADEATRRLVATGKTEDEAYWDIQKLDGYGKTDKLAAAIISGTGFDAAYEELASHGYQRKDINGMVSTLVKTWLQGKPSSSGKAYKGHRVDEKAAVDLLVKYANEDREEAEKKVLKWSMYVDTGHDYSEIEEMLLAGDISEDDAIELMMTYGDKDESEAELTAQAYLWREENQAYADLSEQKIDRFVRYCDPAGIDIEEFYEANAAAADMKKDEIVDMILGLGLTAKQEEAMWYALKQSSWKNTDTPWE